MTIGFSCPVDEGTAVWIFLMASSARVDDLAPTYTVPFAVYKILANSNPMPDAAPVTRNT